MKKHLVVAFAAASLAGAANADTWLFSYAGGGVSASGSFTTAGSAAVAELVTSISGTYSDSFVTGAAITGLLAPGSDPWFLWDNMFQSSDPYFNVYGLGFSVAGLGSMVNFWQNATNNFTSATHVGDAYQETTVSSFTVSVVPEPEAYGLALAGLAVAGLFGRQRRPAKMA